MYAQLQTIAVQPGAFVKRGERIGTVGNAGGTYQAHLHWEIRQTVGEGVGPGFDPKRDGLARSGPVPRRHRGARAKSPLLMQSSPRRNGMAGRAIINSGPHERLPARSAAFASGGSVDAFATYDQILRCAQKAVPARHTLMDDPARAEIVFLALSSQEFGPFLERVRRHPLVRPIRDRLIVYSPNDHILPVLRGLYASIDKKWIEAGRALPVHYLNRHIPRLEIRDGELGQKDIACSFVGSSHTHPVRKRILEECRSGQVYLFDSCPDARQGWWWVRQDAEELKRNYREILVRSRSVICPRGISPASMRLFEAMEAGAMPVVRRGRNPAPVRARLGFVLPLRARVGTRLDSRAGGGGGRFGPGKGARRAGGLATVFQRGGHVQLPDRLRATAARNALPRQRGRAAGGISPAGKRAGQAPLDQAVLSPPLTLTPP